MDLNEETELRKTVATGKRAEELLNDPVLSEAFAKLEKKYLTDWRNSQLGEKELREDYFLLLRNLDGLRLELRKLMDNGKVATATLQRFGKK